MKLTDEQFRALLDLMMCSDPYPVDGESGTNGQIVLGLLLDEESRARGFDNWIVAFHEQEA